MGSSSPLFSSKEKFAEKLKKTEVLKRCISLINIFCFLFIIVHYLHVEKKSFKYAAMHLSYVKMKMKLLCMCNEVCVLTFFTSYVPFF